MMPPPARALSPIERMIDAACGFRPNAPGLSIRLECPYCRRHRMVTRHEIDPPTATRLVSACGECPDSSSVEYFDAAGRLVPL